MAAAEPRGGLKVRSHVREKGGLKTALYTLSLRPV
jgi:hypothetical protein